MIQHLFKLFANQICLRLYVTVGLLSGAIQPPACSSAELKIASRSSAGQNSSSPEAERLEFDVIIAGGSTAAFAAAIAAAESGAKTALLEPTDWVGGQLTSSGVPAVDEAWHTVGGKTADEKPFDVSVIARTPANITPNFLALLKGIAEPADCWVSRFCFAPDRFLTQQLHPMQRAAGKNLTVFLNTVVKSIELDPAEKRVVSVTAISRMPRKGLAANGYDLFPSADLPDWYSPQPSERFDKKVRKFAANTQGDRTTIFIDATEWGELLALSGKPYLLGVEESDGATNGDDSCGQSTVYCFVQEFLAKPRTNIKEKRLEVEHLGFGDYREKADAWNLIWTYRRIRGSGDPAPGDLCLQNWGYSAKLGEGGNDYPFGYLFRSVADAAQERDDWRGGVDLEVMAAAEQRALGWHEWFQTHSPPGIDPRQIVLNSTVLGTSHGLAKLPYIRDTRRSIGLDGFVLRFADLTGPASQRVGTPFEDRVALGAYPADIHSIADCKMPAYARSAHDTLPFYIPFRALTHGEIDNLLVAGKTMAQSFLANSATRLHPIEWSSGTAAGVAAAELSRSNMTSREAYESISELQNKIRRHTPLEWKIDGRHYPDQVSDRKSNEKQNTTCRNDSL